MTEDIKLAEEAYNADSIKVLKGLDRDFVKNTIDDPKFADLFYPNCQDEEIAAFLKSL